MEKIIQVVKNGISNFRHPILKSPTRIIKYGLGYC